MSQLPVNRSAYYFIVLVVSTVNPELNVTERINDSVEFCVNATLPDYGLNDTLMIFFLIRVNNSALRKLSIVHHMINLMKH